MAGAWWPCSTYSHRSVHESNCAALLAHGSIMTSTLSTRCLLDGVAMPVPHRSNGASTAASSPRNDLVKNYRAPDALIDLRTGADLARPAESDRFPAHGPVRAGRGAVGAEGDGPARAQKGRDDAARGLHGPGRFVRPSPRAGRAAGLRRRLPRHPRRRIYAHRSVLHGAVAGRPGDARDGPAGAARLVFWEMRGAARGHLRDPRRRRRGRAVQGLWVRGRGDPDGAVGPRLHERVPAPRRGPRGEDLRSIGRVHRLLHPNHLRGRPRGPVRKYGDGRRRRGRRRVPLRAVGAPRDLVPMFLRSDVARRGHRRRPLRHTLGERPVPRRRRFIRSALLRRVWHGGCGRRRGRATRGRPARES